MDWGTGIFAIAGTIAGGLGSYCANRLNVVANLKQAKHARANELKDRRYAAHLAMVGSVDGFAEASRRYYDALGQREGAQAQSAQTECAAARAKCSDHEGAALLAGPQAVKLTVLKLSDAIAKYSDELSAGTARIRPDTI